MIPTHASHLPTPLYLAFTSVSPSRSSACELEDSVFAEAKSRLSSLASSLVKHQRSLSRGRDEDDDDSGTFRPRRCPWRDLLDLIFII